MRGTGYAITEIILWMVVAGVIGVVIGWILRSAFGGGSRLEETEAKLEKEKARYASISTELGDWKRKVDKLKGSVKSGSAELAEAKELNAQLEEDLTGARSEATDLATRLGDLESSLAEARTEMEGAAGRARELEGKMNAMATQKEAEIKRLGNEVAELAALKSAIDDRDVKIRALDAELDELRVAHAGCGVAGEEASGRIAGLEAALAERDEEISRITAEVSPSAGRDAAAAAPAAAPKQLSWAHGATTLGTPGDDHKDDLKVINGIGPKLEETLNGFGIQSWEQLAALTPGEIAKVEEALDEFPGRIQRDEWVNQAADLAARFPDRHNRPDRDEYLNEAPD